METQKTKPSIERIIERTIGYVLLSAPLVSVIFLFIYLAFGHSEGDNYWTGYAFLQGGLQHGYNEHGEYNAGVVGFGGAAYTSALPFYFGLMALAGAYLIKDSKK